MHTIIDMNINKLRDRETETEKGTEREGGGREEERQTDRLTNKDRENLRETETKTVRKRQTDKRSQEGRGGRRKEIQTEKQTIHQTKMLGDTAPRQSIPSSQSDILYV